MLLEIFSYVDTEDALRLREVSRCWNSTIASLTPYWRRKLDRQTLEKYSHRSPLPSLTAAWLRHKKWVRTCACQQLQPAASRHFEGTALWGRATNDFLLLHKYDTTAWVCYSHHTNEVLQCKDDVFRQSRPYSGKLKEYPSVFTHIGCCDNCFLVARIQAERGTFLPIEEWNLQVFKIGKGGQHTIRRTIEVEHPDDMVQWLLLPHSDERDEDGFCRQHHLLYQSSSLIVVNQFTHDADTVTIVQTHRVVIPYSNVHTRDQFTGQRCVASMRFSSDCTLLANMLDPYHLYVWDTRTWDLVTDLELCCLKNRRTNSSRAVIIAIGHLYTVIATSVENSRYAHWVHIIATNSGELLNECPTQLNWFRMVEMKSMVVLNEDWLNDVYCYNNPLIAYMSSEGDCKRSPISYLQFNPVKKPHTRHFLKRLFRRF